MRKKLRDKRFAIVNCETTGLDAGHHEVVEFGVVYLDGRFESFKIAPQHIDRAHPKALEVNGYTPEAWVDALSPLEAATRIGAILTDCVVAGYNVKFDLGFIQTLLKEQGVKASFGHHAVDVAALAYEHLVPIGLEILSLKNVCQFIGVPPEPDKHDALNGALACRSVYLKLARANWFQRLIWKLRNRG